MAPSPRGTAQYTARVPTHDPPDLVPFAPTLPPPARRPPVPRITTATQEHHGARRRRPARAAGATPRPPPTHRDMNDPTQHNPRLVSPSPRPAASSRTSPSILYASTAHRGVALTSRRRATAPPMRVAEVRRPRDNNETPSLEGAARRHSRPPCPRGAPVSVGAVLVPAPASREWCRRAQGSSLRQTRLRKVPGEPLERPRGRPVSRERRKEITSLPVWRASRQSELCNERIDHQ